MKKSKSEVSDSSKTLFLVLFSFVMGGLIMVLILKYTPIFDNSTTPITEKKGKNVVYEKTSLAAAVDNIYDAVVMVKSFKGDEEYSTGTGFVYKTDNKFGYLITNHHVVSGCNSVKLVLSTDEEVEAKILGGDEYLDIAVLSIPKEKVLKIATIGNSDKVSVGDTIFTVGSPMGYDYRGSVTSGILSGKDRMVSLSVSGSTSEDWVMKVLQIDAAINPGNSGGPLIYPNGEVLGINTVKISSAEGIGFAVPINIIKPIIESFKSIEEFEEATIGIYAYDKEVIPYLNGGSNANFNKGIYVAQITKKGPADGSELKEGDIITSIDNVTLNTMNDLRQYIYTKKPKEEVTFVLSQKRE